MHPNQQQTVRPVLAEERIELIDVLRGFSLLGILLLNIVSFALPAGAYMNPQIYGGSTGPNYTYWLTHMVLFDGKMRAIFSMLFGAGAIILTSRAERRGAGVEAADIYYRRTMWLIVIGLLHAYLIWYGDILYSYGLVGLLLFPFRKASARALVFFSAVLITVHSLQGVGGMFAIREMKQNAEKAAQAEKAGRKPTDDEKAAAKEWASLQEFFAPSKESVDKEIKAHLGGWLSALKHRAPVSAQFQTSMFFQFIFLDVFGMLILGMGLAKAGVFDAALSNRAYTAMIVVGLGAGLPLNYWAASKWAASGWAIPEYLGFVASTADTGRFLVAGAYIGAVMLLCKAGLFAWLRYLLASVGRMALTNYLLTSIVCTFVFDGWGLGLFARYERHQLIWFVLGMWAINLTLSPLWLRYFRFGPAEWGWRSLTYWQRQPVWRVQPERPTDTGAAPAMQEA